MKVPRNALLAVANGERFFAKRNAGPPRLEQVERVDLELTSFSAGVRHRDPTSQCGGSTQINELAHGAAIAEWPNGQALAEA